MSMTNTKAKKSVSKAKAGQIDTLLAQIAIEYVPFNQLVRSDLNARKKAPTPAGIIELACSIAAVGLLQNLIVYPISETAFGVIAGGRRLLALELLNQRDAGEHYNTPALKEKLKDAGLEDNHPIIPDDYPVRVKIVSQDMAQIMSLTENGQREAMHVSDQLAGFTKLSESGHTPAKIAELMGYSTKHVQRCLRVASMSPQLLELLANDNITLDQLQALALTEDHQCQWDTWNNAYCYNRTPDDLRRKIANGEPKAENSGQLQYVGRDAYEAAGGTFRFDLFTDEGYISNASLLERLTREKLTEEAKAIAASEGWAWSEGRMGKVNTYGEDSALYRILRAPEPVYTEEQQSRKAYLNHTMTGLEEQLCENPHDEEETGEVLSVRNALQEELDQLTETAIASAWLDDVKIGCGVVVSLNYGEICIQRGIQLKADDKHPTDEHGESTAGIHSSSADTDNDTGTKLSEKLIKSLSSERTIAVQAALAQRVDVALPLVAHTLITEAFGAYHCSPLQVRLQKNYHQLKDNAPTLEGSRADKELGTLHEAWLARFPDEWAHNFEWLLTWSQNDLVAIISYCASVSLNAVTTSLIDGQAGYDLIPVEKALSFNMRDYWQPTKDNYFGRINKQAIANSLVEAGLDIQVMRVATLKKGDAAEVAEQGIAKTRWIPACLHQSERISEEGLDEINDVVEPEDTEEQAA